jgi:hypothetical protein
VKKFLFPKWVAKLVALCVADRTWEEVFTLMREEYQSSGPISIQQ